MYCNVSASSMPEELVHTWIENHSSVYVEAVDSKRKIPGAERLSFPSYTVRKFNLI